MARWNLTLEERFWAKVDRSGECWVWTGYRIPSGYGNFRRGKRMELSHRVAYELTYGPVGEGLHVCHHCDNPPCVNPAHLFAATNADNRLDSVRKNRHAKGASNGHAKLSPEDVLAIRSASGFQREIAATFGISQTAVGMIKRQKRWKHL